MNSPFRLRPLDLVLLIVNVFVLGGCVVLLAIGGPTGPLVLLMVGTLGLAAGKVMRGLGKGKQPDREEGA